MASRKPKTATRRSTATNPPSRTARRPELRDIFVIEDEDGRGYHEFPVRIRGLAARDSMTDVPLFHRVSGAWRFIDPTLASHSVLHFVTDYIHAADVSEFPLRALAAERIFASIRSIRSAIRKARKQESRGAGDVRLDTRGNVRVRGTKLDELLFDDSGAIVPMYANAKPPPPVRRVPPLPPADTGEEAALRAKLMELITRYVDIAKPSYKARTCHDPALMMMLGESILAWVFADPFNRALRAVHLAGNITDDDWLRTFLAESIAHYLYGSTPALVRCDEPRPPRVEPVPMRARVLYGAKEWRVTHDEFTSPAGGHRPGRRLVDAAATPSKEPLAADRRSNG